MLGVFPRTKSIFVEGCLLHFSHTKGTELFPTDFDTGRMCSWTCCDATLRDNVNSGKTMNLLKLEVGINHLICRNHAMKLNITKNNVRSEDACARAIGHLQIRLQICLAILTPVQTGI